MGTPPTLIQHGEFDRRVAQLAVVWGVQGRCDGNLVRPIFSVISDALNPLIIET
jgi:hypothetical protein